MISIRSIVLLLLRGCSFLTGVVVAKITFSYFETRISATTILNHVIGYVNNGYVAPSDVEWISETFALPKTEKGNAIKDHKQIENIINLALYSLQTEIETQSKQRMTAAQKDLLKKALKTNV